MNFSPRDEVPKVVVFVSERDVLVDAAGVVHYVHALGVVMRPACNAAILADPCVFCPITCLACLGLTVR